jgi:hypothetical protein
MMKIHEASAADGGLSAVFLRFEAGRLEIVADDGARALAADALGEVMAHFGAPLDPDEPVTLVASLALDQGRVLRHVRHLSGYDVIARDYLVYAAAGQEPVCALAATVAGALAHLAKTNAPDPI